MIARHLKTLFVLIGGHVALANIPAHGQINVELFANGLTEPVFLTAPAGDTERVYIVEQRGIIQLYKNGVSRGTFLDIQNKVISGGEQGLLGLAFHPAFPDTPYFYVNYTASGGGGGGHTVVARYQITTSPDTADVNSETIILTQDQPEANHNGGMLAFGPNDDYLYIGFGDGGGANDEHGAIGNGQNPTTWLGKILRVDVDGPGPAPYSIPPDNPFVNAQDTLSEIWALGVRNPWRFSFDPASGELYIADVGQGLWEEIDVEPVGSGGGVNWGWRLKEGDHCFNPPTTCDPSGITTAPLYEYRHDSGRCSVTGGYVYRGCELQGFDGSYFFADFCTGEVWSFEYTAGSVQNLQLRLTMSLVSSFGVDGRGELYICQLDGSVYRVILDGPPVVCGGCCQTPGDANHDSTFNIADITYAIARIFSGGPPSPCQDETDANGDNTFNIADISFMISRIFSGGSPPVCGTTGS